MNLEADPAGLVCVEEHLAHRAWKLSPGTVVFVLGGCWSSRAVTSAPFLCSGRAAAAQGLAQASEVAHGMVEGRVLGRHWSVCWGPDLLLQQCPCVLPSSPLGVGMHCARELPSASGKL